MRRVIPKHPSRRSIRNHLEMLRAMHDNNAAVIEQKPVRRSTPKKQAESAVSEANRQWARAKGGRLARNRRGMMDMPGGGKLPFGLPHPFIQDDVGYLPVIVSASMVGKMLPVLCCIEAKTDTGVVEPHQQQAIEELRDIGAIAGVARSVEDCDAILARWLLNLTQDQR